MHDAAVGNELDTPGTFILLMIWIAAVFLTILVHELGHTLAYRRYGRRSHIVLYHFGGLAISDSFGAWNAARQRHMDAKQQWVISAAGPGIQLLLALVVAIIALCVGVPTLVDYWLIQLLQMDIERPVLGGSIVPYAIFDAILWPSIFWALLNLAPVLPLDGGNICRETLAIFGVDNPTYTAQLISVVTAGGIAFLFLMSGMMMGGIMFAAFAISNWQMMQYRGF